MTARNKNTGESFQLHIGGKTISLGTVLVALMLLNTPVGAPFWQMVGLPPLAQQTNDVVKRVETDMTSTKNEVASIKAEVAGMKSETASLKNEVAALNGKIARVETTVDGFLAGAGVKAAKSRPN